MKSKYFIDAEDSKVVKSLPSFRQDKRRYQEKEQDEQIRRALIVGASNFLTEQERS